MSATCNNSRTVPVIEKKYWCCVLNWNENNWKQVLRHNLQCHQEHLLGLYIVYFKWCDTYHDTHEVTFDMYQQYILSVFRPAKLDMSTNFTGSWEF